MISDTILTICILSIVALLLFIVKYARKGKLLLIHRLYLFSAVLTIFWMLCVILTYFLGPEDVEALQFLDALMYLCGPMISVLSLLISLTFIKGLEHLPRSYYALLIMPLLTVLVVWTNPLHHLYYEKFSIYSAEIELGPFSYVAGLYSYLCMLLGIVLILRFGIRASNRLYLRQAILFSFGSFVPFLVNSLGIFKLCNLSVAATPLSLIATMFFHGFAIYQFHFLDIKPIAMQQVLNWISDCYLVTTNEGLIVSFNQPFAEVFGKQYGLRENLYLQDCLKIEDVHNKTAIYNLMTSIDSCRNANAIISYEQDVSTGNPQQPKRYFVVDITPLVVRNQIEGFIVIFKDVTKVKESMQRLQDSTVRMMEQERLASLGQMVGGLAHNLKTPIMSISGSATAIDNLVAECAASLDDPEVTDEDYQEIYGEMRDWLYKVREACSYMSDIITAVKGQASNMNASDGMDFTMDEVVKRVTLLMRHEILGSGCKLLTEDRIGQNVVLHGDINNLVQVFNNLVSNAVDAQKKDGRRDIVLGIDRDDRYLLLTVRDYGTGVPADIKDRLFKQMITSKGSMGTGLGIYISNTVIRAKFEGTMWVEDNPEGGTVFGISIPLGLVTFRSQQQGGLKTL